MKKLLTIILSSLYLVSMPALANAQAAISRPASMYFSPTSGTVTLNSAREFTVSVMVNTGGADASGADSHVTFDITKLAFVSGTYPASTNFFPHSTVSMPTATTANASGKVSMARVIETPAEGDPMIYTNGVGTFSTLTFKALTGVTTATLSFIFTLGGTDDSNVASGVTSGLCILGSATPATYTFIAGGGGTTDTDPYIDSIVPEEGDEDTETELVIYGGNFGTEDGHVYIGTRLATVIDWTDDEITVTVPAISVNRDTQYQVKVKRTDNKTAIYQWFTIVDTGLAGILWMGLIPFNGAAAILIKRRWFTKKQVEEAVSIPIQIIG